MPAAFPPAGSSTLEKGDARLGIWVLSHGIHPHKGFENPRQRKDFEPFFIALVGLPNPMPRRRMPPGMDGAPSSHVGVPPRVRSGRGGAGEMYGSTTCTASWRWLETGTTVRRVRGKPRSRTDERVWTDRGNEDAPCAARPNEGAIGVLVHAHGTVDCI